MSCSACPMPGLTGKLDTLPFASARNGLMSMPLDFQYARNSGSRLLIAGQM